MAVYQLGLMTQGHGNALGYSLGALVAAGFSALVTPKEEEIAGTELVPRMRRIIHDAIEKGLLEQEDVTAFLALQAIQNLIIFNSLNHLPAKKFAKIFSKLMNEGESGGPIVNQEKIEEWQDRLKKLSKKDLLILEQRLSRNETDDQPDNNKEVQDLFKAITTLAFNVWYKYQAQIKEGIKEKDPESEEVTLAFYDRFMEFLAEK